MRLLDDEGAGGGSRVDRQAPPPAIDPDQPVIPMDLHCRPHQGTRHGVEGSLHLDVAPGGRSGSPLKDVEGTFGQGPQGRLVHLQEVAVDLLPGGAVDAQPGQGPVPALEEAVAVIQSRYINQFLASNLCVVLVFLSYNALAEIKRAMGKGALISLVFGTQQSVRIES